MTSVNAVPITAEVISEDDKWLKDVKEIILSSRDDIDMKGVDKVLLTWAKVLDRKTIKREVAAAMNWLVSNNKKYKIMSRYLNSWLKKLARPSMQGSRKSNAKRLQKNPVSLGSLEMLKDDFLELFSQNRASSEQEVLEDLRRDRDLLFGVVQQKIKTIKVEETA